MKEFKVAVIAALITIALLMTCAFAMPAEAESDPNLSDFYPTTAVVTKLDYELNKVSCTTYNGHVYEFYGCYDWAICDVCSLYMWDCGTPLDITDDEVIDVEYSGTLSAVATAEWLRH